MKFCTKNCTKFTRDFTRVFAQNLHSLIINFLLNLGDLVAKSKIKLEIIFDFFDTVKDSGVVFDTDFGGDFGST